MPKFSKTIAAYGELPLPAQWKFLFLKSCLDGVTEVEIDAEFRGESVQVGSNTEIIAENLIDGLKLVNNSANAVTVLGVYGKDRYKTSNLEVSSVSVTSLPGVTITTIPAVEIAANDTLSVSGDTNVGTTGKADLAAPAGAKGAIVSLITPGFTFGEVRVSGSNVYAADTGIPLPVDGGSIYLDVAATLTLHNKHAGNAADVNVTWISKS